MGSLQSRGAAAAKALAILSGSALPVHGLLRVARGRCRVSREAGTRSQLLDLKPPGGLEVLGSERDRAHRYAVGDRFLSGGHAAVGDGALRPLEQRPVWDESRDSAFAARRALLRGLSASVWSSSEVAARSGLGSFAERHWPVRSRSPGLAGGGRRERRARCWQVLPGRRKWPAGSIGLNFGRTAQNARPDGRA